MECGHLKGVGHLTEVEKIENPSLGLWLQDRGGRLIGVPLYLCYRSKLNSSQNYFNLSLILNFLCLLTLIINNQ